jgi:phosphoglycerate dehydrogenase-like enzyme
MTLLLMLGALRRIAYFDTETRAGRGWSQPPALQDHLFELGGRKVGLVGYGAVPKLLAPILQAMGCKILYTARAPKPEALGTFLPFEALLAEADVVSLHIPETPETRGLLNGAAIARMKPGAVLVNTARGGLVDQAALAAALRSGHLAAAGLDVFAVEPLNPADPLLGLPNVVLAPHVAWLSTGTFARSFSIAGENCRRLASGEALLHRVA